MTGQGDGMYTFEAMGGTEDASWLEEARPGILALFSIFKGQAIYVGSAFMIDGIDQFATARHVAESLRNYDEETYHEANACALVTGPNGGLVGILRLNMSPDENITSDLATGHLDRAMLTAPLPYFQLTDVPVVVGESVTAIGHAFMPDEVIPLVNGVFSIEAQLRAIGSPVVEIHEKWTNLPSPSFMLNEEMPGGMSGGPIVRDSTGEIVGACSYGLVQNSGEHEPYCHGSMLGPLWQPYGYEA